MTREQMAQAVETLVCETLAESEARAIAAELRKSCAGCRHFDDAANPHIMNCRCPQHRDSVPADGSGYCHRWEAK